MSKEKFFKELEERLQILKEEERKDIINEYKDTLSEKMKHGRSEKEAIEDFGPMDELVKEILSAYKINPDFNDKKSQDDFDFSEVTNSVNRGIKKCASSISSWFHDLNDELKDNGQELTIEFVTELVIKGIITLFILALVTLPFNFLRYIGSNILTNLFFPLSDILNIVWYLLIGVLYFCVCALIIIAMYKDSFKGSSKKEVVKDTKSKKKEKKETVPLEENKSKEAKKKTHIISNTIVLVIKVLVAMFILFPLWCTIIGFAVTLSFVVYYLFQGVPIWGLLLLFIGLLAGFAHLTKVITDLTFYHKRVYFYPFVISAVLVTMGALLTFDLATNITYHEGNLPKDASIKTERYNFDTINDKTSLYLFGKDFEVFENSELKDGEIVVEVTYYDEYVTPKYHCNYDFEYGDDYINFYIDTNPNAFFKLYHDVLDNLKNKEVYTYNDDTLIKDIKIYVNSNTKGLIN